VSEAPHVHWQAGALVEPELAPRRAGWSWLLGVLVLVLFADLVLALVPAPADPPSDAERLDHALADAEQGRAVLVLGDPTQLDALADELAPHADARVHVLDARSPREVLHIVEALDAREPSPALELVVMLELAALGHHAAPPRERTLDTSSHARLRSYVPLLRHARPVAPLDAALAHTQADAPTPEPSLAERLRDVSLDAAPQSEAARELEALDRLLARLAARGRRATFVLPPLPDRELARAELDVDALAGELAVRVNQHERDTLALVSLDHPLFVDAHFEAASARLGDEGRQLLAKNLLHQLGLPLATRLDAPLLVQPEGFDRTLVHGLWRGDSNGPAWAARFAQPSATPGVAPPIPAIGSDAAGERIVVADTGNHVLRVLRGNHQIVEPLAGVAGEAGWRDGAAAQALLDHPGALVVLDDRVVFVDGESRERLRSVAHGLVHTLEWSGPRCASIDALRHDRTRARLVLLCDDERVLALDLATAQAERLAAPHASHDRVAIEVTPRELFWADDQARLFSAPFDARGRLGRMSLRFANTARVTLPNRYMAIFPYDFDDVGLSEVVGLQWVERYGALLVVDRRAPLQAKQAALVPELGLAQLQRPPSERIQLRLFDFESEQIWPWIKAIPHGDAHFALNAPSRVLTSTLHEGSFALVERDASLLWLEHERSRLVRLADGMLGVAASGYLHTGETMTDRLIPLCSRSARKALAQYRPDRFLDRRHEPIPRKGPYVALLISSSMSTMSDRFDTYDLARLLEYELQRELGVRDGIRLDLFHRSWPVASLVDEIGQVDEFLGAGPPPDVILLEVHSFTGRYLSHSKDAGAQRKALAELRALAERYDSLIVFYDNSAMASHQRDGFRGTSRSNSRFLAEARRLGFVVLEPGDALMRELLVESPWGNQPWAKNGHHGATWAVEHTARMLAHMLAPSLREFLRGRTPARLHERDPDSFEDPDFRALRVAWSAATPSPERLAALPELEREYIQVHYAQRHLRVFVDLGGHESVARDEASLRALALAVIAREVDEGMHGELADRITIELVEFSNYDEYGAGVLDSAKRVWQRSMTTSELEAFLREE
jgi:hypothetical protein